VEYRLYRADGSFGWMFDQVTPLFAPDGDFVAYMGCTIPIRASDQAQPESLCETLNDRILDGNQYWTKLLDTQGRLLSMSAGGQRLLEISDITPHLNQSWRDIWPDAYRPAAYAAVDKAAAGGTGTFVGFCPTVKGTPKWWHVVIVPAATEPGSKPRLLAMFRDVTEQKQAEEAIKRSEAEFRAIFELSSVGIAQMDYHSKRYTKVNPRFCEILGYTAEELEGVSLRDLTPMDTELEHNLALHDALERGERDEYALEKRLLRKDGRTVWVQVTGTALRDAHGNITNITGMVQDISARKTAEQTLLDSEHRYRALMEHASDAILVADANGRCIDANRRAVELFGYTKQQLLQTSLSQLYPCVLQELDASGASLNEHELCAKDGRRIPVEIAGTRIPFADSHLYLGSFRDISGRRRQEMAERANQDKTRFLATASHDLRQPIQAIHLLLHLLLSHDLPPAAAGIAERIQGAVEGLGRIVDTLLDISKLDAGVIKPRLSRFHLGALLRELVDEHRPLSERVGVSVSYVNCNVHVESDRDLLARILRNLISNAIKYAPLGRILVGVRRSADRAWVQVLDTGIGIAPGDIDAVFEEFRQIGNSARDRREGLGLGLSIVQRLANLLEHPLKVSSVPGRGSCFAVSVPTADHREHPARYVTPQSPGTAARARTEILVVDDEVDIREGLAMVLTGWGYSVRVAADLVHAMAGWEVDNPPALVIADFRLGKETGIDVIQAVRRRVQRPVPALLLTGDATPETAREAARLDVQLLRKPLSVDQLRRAILEYLT
jgi:PAS domain S-box-containing protein